MDLNSFMSAGVVVIVIAVLFMAWNIWRTGERPQTLGDWALQVEAAEAWALLAVKAAEQLMESGQITKDMRFEHADAFLVETLPNLDESQRRMLVESAVWILNKGRASGIIPHAGIMPAAGAHEPLTERVEELEDMHSGR